MRSNQVLPSASTFRGFFGNSENKIRLQKFLHVEFQMLVDNKVDIYYTINQRCYHLNRDKLSLEYTCYHHEADTRIFYHAEIITRSRNYIVLTIDSDDTDVIFISAYYAHTTEVPVLLYKKGRLYNCKRLCSSEEAAIILPFHAFTGADYVSAFFGHSKATIWKRLNDNLLLLSKLGREIQISEDVKKDLEMFTIRVVYNDRNSTTLNEARAWKWTQMKNKGTIRLPPDYDSFVQHLKRSNYVTYTLFSYDNPDALSPINHGFMLGDNENVIPLMHTTPSDTQMVYETLDSDVTEDTDDECESDID